MKFAKSKIATIMIAIFLMISMSASMMLIPNTSAHTPAWVIPTYAFINAAPNPVGVGQQVNIIMWIDKIPDGAAVENTIRWHNYNLTITEPDHTTATTIFATCQDTTSAQFFSYTPDQTGTYTFTFTFPQQNYTYTGLISGFFGPPAPSAYTNDTYQSSTATTTLTVQDQPITSISSYPLPTEFWTRPIYGENNDWWTISSNWLGTGSPQFTTENSYHNVYIPDAVGSQTSHVMWTKELQSGGIVGGNDFSVQGSGYFEGSAYINRYTNPIILDGMLFYNNPLSFSTGNGEPTTAVDLRTGQVIWSRSDVLAPSFGLVFNVPLGNPNQHGVFPPMLVTTAGGYNFFTGAYSPPTWVATDADTGNWIFNVTGVPTGVAALGPEGEYLIYTLANDAAAGAPAHYYLSEWNSTRAMYNAPGGFLAPVNFGTFDASAANNYDWNVSIPQLNSLTAAPTQIAAYYNDIMLCYNGTLPSGGSPAAFGRLSNTPYSYFALSLNATSGTKGALKWINTLQPPAGNITVFAAGVDPVSRVFIESYKETKQWVAYNLDTGAKLWGPIGNETALDYYANDFGGVPNAELAYGNLYYSGFGGVVYCYDAQTGALKFTYGNGGIGNSTNSGTYTGYGIYPTFITAIGNGIVYTETTEHTILDPIYKGALTRAINATDGTELWTLSAFTGGGGGTNSYAMADGFNTWFNGYDNQIYTVGRGPTALTVSAPDLSAAFGQPVMIHGTVTDISAGTTQVQQVADHPNGVPCASDAVMSDWMGYIYQQKPLPTNFVGVDVVISGTDSNNNTRPIGTATTDSTGAFNLLWTPDIAGKYSVVATFAGTNAYWPSRATTAFNVQQEHPTATPAPTQAPSNADLYFVPAIAGLFVAIIVVGAVMALLLLRKRP
jgi:hypothetical protein